jgi:hypothetical protein
MKEALSKRFGEHRVLEIEVGEGQMPLLILDLELKTPVTVVMTNGLRNYKMPVPEKMKGFEHNELYFCLPSYWEWEDRENPNMNWVFDWIQRLSKYVVEKESWFGHGHTMPCGKDMESLSETMNQNHFFLSSPILLDEELTPINVSGIETHFLGIIPIFSDEMDYKQGKGTYKLMKKLKNQNVTEKLDDYRASTLKSKWRFYSR